MRRRDLIIGIAAAWPQITLIQGAATPVIGFVSSSSPSPNLMAAFHQGLNEGGYVEGKNAIIEYRSAGGRYDQLPELVANLVRQRVALIVASGGLPSALAAKAATDTIPILFIAGFDPVEVGLVESLRRPGSTATGVSVSTTELAQKRL